MNHSCKTLGVISTVLVLFNPNCYAQIPPEDVAIRSTNSPSFACGAAQFQIFEKLRDSNDPRAKELSPIAQLCTFEPMNELILGISDNKSQLEKRTADLVNQVREYNGDKMAVDTDRFMKEVMLPLREVLVKNNFDNVRNIVAVENAIQYSANKNYPAQFGIFLEKLKLGYNKSAEQDVK